MSYIYPGYFFLWPPHYLSGNVNAQWLCVLKIMAHYGDCVAAVVFSRWVLCSCWCRLSPLSCHRIIPIQDWMYFIAALSVRREGGTTGQKQQSEFHVGLNGKFYSPVVELVLFSQKPLDTAKEKHLRETDCGSKTEGLWLVQKQYYQNWSGIIRWPSWTQLITEDWFHKTRRLCDCFQEICFINASFDSQTSTFGGPHMKQE